MHNDTGVGTVRNMVTCMGQRQNEVDYVEKETVLEVSGMAQDRSNLTARNGDKVDGGTCKVTNRTASFQSQQRQR